MIADSTEWHEWRKKGVGASEVAAILGICPYNNTPYSVWLVKTGRAKGFEGNSFTQHGKELESKARSRYELVNMEDMRMDVFAIHPKYEMCRASLDGLSTDGKKILEIKCPKGDDTYLAAKGNRVPDHYVPQVQYQLAVTGAEECDFFVYHEGHADDALVTVKPDVAYQGKIIAAVVDFWNNYVLADIAPPLTDKDVRLIVDDEAIALICQKIKALDPKKQKKEIDWLKAEAVLRAGHPKMKCGDVQVSTVNRDGKFSYHKLTISKTPSEDHSKKES